MGMADFLENEIVKSIIEEEKKDGPEIGIDYENPEDYPPELSETRGTVTKLVAKGGTITVSLGESVTITVTNADIYESIDWLCNGVSVGTKDSSTYAIDTADAPFNDEEGTYPLAVTGTKDGTPYSTDIKIIVTE
jgi:hypothetical protein